MDSHAVIYSSAGCIPDNIEDGPEFTGTLEECIMFVKTEGQNYERPDVEHDLYSLEIVELEDNDDLAHMS